METPPPRSPRQIGAQTPLPLVRRHPGERWRLAALKTPRPFVRAARREPSRSPTGEESPECRVRRLIRQALGSDYVVPEEVRVRGCSPHLTRRECPTQIARERQQARVSADATPAPRRAGVQGCSKRLYDQTKYLQEVIVTKERGQHLGVVWGEDCRIRRVKDGSPAALAGLRQFQGRVVSRINNIEVVSSGDLDRVTYPMTELHISIPGPRPRPNAGGEEEGNKAMVLDGDVAKRLYYLPIKVQKDRAQLARQTEQRNRRKRLCFKKGEMVVEDRDVMDEGDWEVTLSRFSESAYDREQRKVAALENASQGPPGGKLGNEALQEAIHRLHVVGQDREREAVRRQAAALPGRREWPKRYEDEWQETVARLSPV
eukprot:Hpha_TRINITY_DN27294_c0_g1::TRINITY_DN27294_c0_g1_i1::g.140793::m.140793